MMGVGKMEGVLKGANLLWKSSLERDEGMQNDTRNCLVRMDRLVQTEPLAPL